MARTATLTMSDKSYSVGLKKLDRKKIYGWSKIDIFDEPASLTKADLDEFLSLNVKSVYQLGVEEGKEELLGLLEGGDIYHFPFNYRADYEADDAFLLTSAGEVFAIVGKKAELEYIGLENKEEEVPEEPEAEAPEEDDFDFGML